MSDGSAADLDTTPTDPYEVLQLHRNAHPLVVMKTFRVLAAMYHPDNKQTGDRAQFERIVNAYRMLSDPVRRTRFDREEVAPGGSDEPVASTRPRAHAANDERRLRMLLLTTLYNTRRGSITRPGLSLRVLADLTEAGLDEVQFSLWYLRGKKLIEIGDMDEVAITVTGVDYVEEHAVVTDELLSLPPSREALGAGDSGSRDGAEA